MNSAVIDLDLLDEGEENPFERIMSALERVKLNYCNVSITTNFEKQVLGLERRLQDLHENNDARSFEIYKRSTAILKAYSAVIENDNTFDSINVVKSSIDSLNKVLASNRGDIHEISKELDSLSPTQFLKSQDIKKVSVDQLKKATEYTVQAHRILSGFYFSPATEKKNEEVWDIDLNFETDEKDKHKPLQFIYLLIELFNNIEDVEIILEDIRIGSIKARLKMYFKSEKGKNDVKEILESSRKFAKGKLEKEFENAEKVKAEREKIDIEKQILKHEFEESKSVDAAYEKLLNLQNREEDLRKKKLENTKLELELLKQSTDLYAEMLASGYISQTNFEMLIKGLPFLKLEDGRMEIGENTQIIDDL